MRLRQPEFHVHPTAKVYSHETKPAAHTLSEIAHHQIALTSGENPSALGFAVLRRIT